MERNNFIIRKSANKDKRSKNIYLTEKSKMLKEESIKIAQETLAEILDGIDYFKIKISKQVLKEICENIEILNPNFTK